MNKIFEDSVVNNNEYIKLINMLSLNLKVSKDSITGYLINSMDTDNKNKIYNNIFYGFLLYIFYPIVLMFLFIGSSFKKNNRSDITFEIWRKDSFGDYYENIVSKMTKEYSINKYETYKYKKSNIDKKEIIKIILLIFFNYKILRQIIILNSKYKINFFYLIIKFFYGYLKFSSEAKYLNTKIIVSALDFNFHILRYELFKKEGILIILIQSSMRTKKLLYYKAGDIVFVFGELQKQLYLNVKNQFKKVVSVGSIKNENYLNNKYEKKFDIMFVEQYYNFDTLSYASNKSYELLLSYLIRFSEENPSYKIIYRTREEKRKREKLFNDILKKINESNILVDTEGDSYEKVASSSVVIGYTSALCFEAIGQNIKTMFFYYDNYKFELFDYENSYKDILITDNSYAAFSSNLQKLIDSKNLKSYFDKYKYIYMNQDTNVSCTISKYIKEGLN